MGCSSAVQGLKQAAKIPSINTDDVNWPVLNLDNTLILRV